MKKAISYSLFGYNKERHKDSFSFESYLRGLLINIRMNRLLFPDWEIVVHMDISTYNGYQKLFDALPIRIKIMPNAPLCFAMLWRMHAIFDYEHPEWTYSHVICRDLDSPPTFRESQAVQDWINSDTCAHAITDSISHNIPLMGGMVGFRPAYFSQMVAPNWEAFIGLDKSINFSIKGSDQTFLNRVVYPKIANPGYESFTHHFVLGHGNTFLSGYKNFIPDLEIGLDPELKESNNVCGHIGSAGAYSSAIELFLSKHKHLFNDIRYAESDYPHIFYWINQSIF